MKIDIHTHIMPEHLPKWAERFGYGGFVELIHQTRTDGKCCAEMIVDGKSFRNIEENSWNPLVRMAECEQHGVHLQTLSTVPVLFSYWAKPHDALDVARFLNDHIAATVNAHPTRFAGLGTLPMQSPELAAKELTRCVTELGLRGAEIGTNINGENLSDEKFFSVFEAAEKLGAALFIHPWEMMGEAQMKKYWLPWLVGMPAETSRAICSMIFGGVFERFPKLRVAFAHGGGSFPATLGRIEHGFEVRPDLCAADNPNAPRSYLGKFFVDSLTHDAAMLEFIVRLFGDEAVMLGSDYPYPLGEAAPGRLIESINAFSTETKEKLLYQNAARWLGLSL
jgi:aminocarboxymuconate-semialdehyde decarboxylase